MLGISELVFCNSGDRCRVVKQLDTHLCPVLYDKLVFDQVDEAKTEAVEVYLSSLLHAFSVNESIHPEVLKIYAREPVQLELFMGLEKAIGSTLPNFKVRTTGRWLNVEGHLGGKEKDVH